MVQTSDIPASTVRILLGILFLLLIWSGFRVWQEAHAYDRETQTVIAQLEAQSRLESSGRKLLEALSFGLYEGYSEQIEELNRHRAQQLDHHRSVRLQTALFFSAALLTALVGWWMQRTAGLGYALIGVAFVSLVVGLTTPILSLEASKELPLLGKTVFQFQSKGVLSTIAVLEERGNLWLAALLFLFSVLIPIAKTLLAWLTLFERTHSITLHGLKLSRHLGKWSMADVFVVAILVVFFSSEGGNGLTRAEVQAGLWFFAAYVVLSLVGTQLIARGRED